ncbi:MAG: hypothetical protein ACOH1O_00190 [Flavobacterium sp.]
MEIVFEFIFEVIFCNTIRYSGAAVRFAFMHKKFTFDQVLKQDWNNRIGIIVLSVLIGLLIWTCNMD